MKLRSYNCMRVSRADFFGKTDRIELVKSQIEHLPEGIGVIDVGGEERIHIFNPRFIKFIMEEDPNNLIRSPFFRSIENMMPHGLFNLDDYEWQRARASMNTHFDKEKVISTFNSSLQENTHELVDIMAERNEDYGRLNLSKEFDWISFDLIGRACLGRNRLFCTTEDFGENDFYYKYQSLLQNNTRKQTPRWLHWLPGVRNVRKNERYLHRVVEETLHQRREDLEGGDRRRYFVDMFTRQEKYTSEKQFVEEEAIHQILSLMFGAHRPMASLLTWVVYHLCSHPEWYERVTDEIRSTLPEHDLTQPHHMSKLHSLDMVVKETLRMTPPVQSIERALMEGRQMDGFPLPEHYPFTIDILALHHNPKVYDNPQEFRPDRFSKKNEGKIPNFSYIPFGVGQRKCIGHAFASLECNIVLSHILQNFDIKLDKEQNQNNSTILDPCLSIYPGLVASLVPLHNFVEPDLTATDSDPNQKKNMDLNNSE
eukprot:gb/GECH01013883.1/.p1 GENE.gb/GECH01013883.1/~~gb/GECH01013883.1/.p1  ORF type:complete len:483 (+),score=104.26 gb/GECH01013883.1/:1-1449(+)